MTSRLQEVLRQTPPTTLVVMFVCGALHFLQVVANYPKLHSVTLCPQLVVFHHQAYRMVTSALYHGSFMHIGMNLLSTATLGTMLEKRVGSISLFITILWSILLTSTIYILIALGAFYLFDQGDLLRQHSVGFSGVLFHLTVLECNYGPQLIQRSVLGFGHVSPKVYPWVLLVALQFFIPGLSFTGHLSGILAGQLQYYQCIKCLFPSETYYREMDSWSVFSPVSKLTSFVRTPTNSIETASRDPSSSVTTCCCSTVQFLGNKLNQLLERTRVVVFGRGPQANSNLRLPDISSLPMLSSRGTRNQDDEALHENKQHEEESQIKSENV